MAIYRGTGTSGTTTDSASISDITRLSDAAEDSATAAATSATNAANSAASASTSASNAASNATAASASATQAADAVTDVQTAATQATNAEQAAEGYADDAEASAIAAAGSASGAATSESNAATSATTATTQASAANTSALSASSAATSAATQANISLNAATSAGQSATNAALSETAAANSETAAATSETNAEQSYQDTLAIYGDTQDVADAVAAAETSETNAANSAIAADVSANDAADSETNAAASETAAAGSAAAASVSATAAANSATAASNSASAAASSESIVAANAAAAATSESNAAASATAAAGSQTAAEAAKDAALAALDSFDDRYLGDKATEPTVDNDGNPLVSGALYFNTVTEEMKVYSGTQWLNAYASLSGALLANNNLSDLQSAVTARSNLGLGTAATTDSTAYATAAQGALADTALQSIPSEYLTQTEGDALYMDINAVTLPDQTGHSGQFLSTNGTTADWATVDTSQGDTAYSWGNHADAGYVTSTYTGDVGITGKVSATDGFKVVNSSTPTIEITELGNSVDGNLSFTKNGVEKAGIRTVSGGAYARKGLAFYTNNTGDYTTSSTAKMWLTSAGNLGIGTSSPSAALQVYTGTANNQLYLTSADTGQAQLSFGGTTDPDGGYIRYSDASDWMAFATQTTERMRIDSSGNVGIGTASPSTTLDVNGTASVNYLVARAQDGFNEGGEIQFVGAGTNGTFQIDNHAGNARVFTLGTGKYFEIIGGSGIIANGYNNSNWDTAYSWGNHASAGYQPAGTYNTVIGTDSDINTSGATIIDNIYVTDGVITSMGTRTLTASDIGAGIVNVYTDTQTGVISTSSASFVNTGLSVTFTPASSSSKFVVHVYHNILGDDSGGNSAVQTQIVTPSGNFVADYGSEGTSNNYTTDPTTEVCTFTTGSTASVTVNVRHLRSGGNSNNMWHSGTGTACVVVYEVA